MTKLYRFPLASDVKVVVSSSVIRPIAAEVQREIDAIWEQEKQFRWLFDGVCISLTSISSSLLKGELVPYRAWYAGSRNHAVFEKTHIFPLALSGRTMCDGRVLIGKRSKKVSSQEACYECAPSGTFGRDVMDSCGIVNICDMVRIELEEEAGLSQFISSIQPLALYWSLEDNTWDMHVDIKVACVLGELTSPTGEYDELLWVDPLTVPEGQWVPLSKLLLQVPMV